MTADTLERPELTRPTLTTESAPSWRGRIPELDGFRGIAILLVIACHYLKRCSITGEHTAWSPIHEALALSWSGVGMFFVLSGFLICGILLDAKGSPRFFSTFYLRRAFRIVPLMSPC